MSHTTKSSGLKSFMPNHFPIAYKLAIVFTLLITTGMVALGFVFAQDQTRLLEQQIREASNTVVKQMAVFAKDPLLANDTLSLELTVNNLIRHQSFLGAAIYSEDKVVIAQAGRVPGEVEVQPSMKSKDVVEQLIPLESTNQAPIVSFISPVIFDDIIVGYALVTYDSSVMTKARDRTIKAVAGATILLILLGVLASFVLGERLTRPIYQLMDASRAISAGDYNIRFENLRKDELGSLMQSMNEMTEGLLKKEQVEQTFSRYVSPKVAKEVLKNLSQVELGGRYVNASVVFADIAGFTSLSENMHPQEVNALLNEYFTHISQVGHIYGGHIDKFIGDCVMLVFGVPEEDENHSMNAMLCAVMIQRLVARLNVYREEHGLFPVRFRIGVNTGMMLAGNMGSADRMEYTVVGDAVNVAARLSSAAEPGQTYISEELYASTVNEKAIIGEKQGSIGLKGKTDPVTTYNILDVTDKHRKLMDDEISKILSPYMENA